jgi:hypothetical protein
LDVVSSLRQHGTLRFLVVDFSPPGRKINNSKDGSYALCQIDLRGAHFDVVYSLRQQGIYVLLWPILSPAGEKSATEEW